MLWMIPILWAASPIDKCQPKELKQFDCRLSVDTYNLRLLKDTVAWDDGTWHTVDDMPLKGDGVLWERAEFGFINGWPILQLWLWDAGVGENKVQSLHWFVADAEKRHFTILAQGVVRRRRPHKAAVVDGEVAKFLDKYSYDKMEPHALKPLKSGGLEWTLKDEIKRIERVKHGI